MHQTEHGLSGYAVPGRVGRLRHTALEGDQHRHHVHEAAHAAEHGATAVGVTEAAQHALPGGQRGTVNGGSEMGALVVTVFIVG